MKPVAGARMELRYENISRFDLLHRTGKDHSEANNVFVDSSQDVIRRLFTLSSVVLGLI